jgi:8-oxo-dGTP diphosphatase
VYERVHLALLRVFRHLPRPIRVWVVHRITPSYAVGAICVIERTDGALLLVRHSYRGAWGFPGGLLRRGEDVADGARREALEEVSLDIELVGEPAVVVDPAPGRVDVVFRCRPAAGADLDAVAPNSPEIEELAWYRPEELPELQPEASTAIIALARAMPPGGRPGLLERLERRRS